MCADKCLVSLRRRFVWLLSIALSVEVVQSINVAVFFHHEPQILEYWGAPGAEAYNPPRSNHTILEVSEIGKYPRPSPLQLAFKLQTHSSFTTRCPKFCLADNRSRCSSAVSATVAGFLDLRQTTYICT
jgi:hypothetical protein